jgi:CspA family cold shock protein
MSNNSRFTGIVIFFDPKKGYGFIKRDDSTLPDMFVHFSDIETQGFKTLHKDQRVSFGIGENKKGQPKATEVCVIQ